MKTIIIIVTSTLKNTQGILCIILLLQKGNDVFIMVGHYGSWHDGNWQSKEFVSVDELQWLYETLEANRNKRCFVFVHCLPLAHGVGDPCGLL